MSGRAYVDEKGVLRCACTLPLPTQCDFCRPGLAPEGRDVWEPAGRPGPRR